MALIIVLTNQSKLAPISAYNYEVLVGDGSPERSQILARGSLQGHRRADGWQALLSQLVKEASE